MCKDAAIWSTEHFIQAISGNAFFNSKYMRTMNKHDVNHITKQHEEKHKVPGMLGSIDCTHFFWKN